MHPKEKKMILDKILNRCFHNGKMEALNVCENKNVVLKETKRNIVI